MPLSPHPLVTASTPLKVTLPPVVPNPFPARVIGVPTGPELHGPESHMIPMISTRTYRFGRLLETLVPCSATFTTTGPLSAVRGITATILVSLQLIARVPAPASAIPPRVATLNPIVAPKPFPWMVSVAPTAALFDLTPSTKNPVIVGGAVCA